MWASTVHNYCVRCLPEHCSDDFMQPAREHDAEALHTNYAVTQIITVLIRIRYATTRQQQHSKKGEKDKVAVFEPFSPLI